MSLFVALKVIHVLAAITAVAIGSLFGYRAGSIVIVGNGGSVIRSTDDGVTFSVFNRPDRISVAAVTAAGNGNLLDLAVKAARAIHEAFPPGRGADSLRLRASLNTGTCIAVRLNSAIDYFGHAVNLAAKLQAADYAGQLAAISKAQAVIEFNLDGTVRTANDNFLRALGYSLDEIKGRHHSMFIDEQSRNSGEWMNFQPLPFPRLNTSRNSSLVFLRFRKCS